LGSANALATTEAPTRTQRERSETTTSELIQSARKLFARDGYAATSLDDVVAEAGVSKGALYHHFTGKPELFEAVFVHEERRLCAALVAAYEGRRDPWRGFHSGCQAFLEASLEPGFQRIAFTDAPGVLGLERMREIERINRLALLKEGLGRMMAEKRIRRRDLDPLVYLIRGVLCEGAMFIARADDKKAAMRKYERELKSLLDSLSSA
jgi:AcrR family transcriptional regulator